MSFDFEQENYQKLKARFVGSQKAKIVPFVGAGLSLYGPPEKRLPTWRGLVQLLIARAIEVERLTPDQQSELMDLEAQGLFPEALGKLYSYATVEWVSQSVEKILHIDADGVSPAAVALLAMSWTLIVTTNLDRMLELAHEELVEQGHVMPGSLKAFTSQDEQAFLESMSIERAARTSLAKIHGTVEKYQSFVLTAAAYNNLNDNGVYRYILQDLFRHTLLIIGFSLTDPDFDWAMDHIANNFRSQNSPPYAVLPDTLMSKDNTCPEKQRVLELQTQNNLRVITYKVSDPVDPVDHWSGHRELFECIDDLNKTWQESNQNVVILGAPLAEDGEFVGRKRQLQLIDQAIFEKNRFCQIQGFGGEGKTALVSHWLWTRISRFSDHGIKEVFVFNCHVDSPTKFFVKAAQNLCQSKAGMTRAALRSAIIDHAKTKSTLFIFDQFEVFQDIESDGRIRDPLLADFFEDLRTIGVPVILTTRLALPNREKTIRLAPMTDDDVDKLVKQYRLDNVHPATLKTALVDLRGHAQSIRLFLSNRSQANKSYEHLTVAPDENLSSLGRNKALHTLEQIYAELGTQEKIVLRIASIFRMPFKLADLRDLLNLDLSIFDIWPKSERVQEELSPYIDQLINRGLLVCRDALALYQLHPNVRDFMHVVHPDNTRLHRAYSQILEDLIPKGPVENIATAVQYFDLCHHAIKSEDWTRFDNYFRVSLMRGPEDHACDTLGMWSESLDVTKTLLFNKMVSDGKLLDLPYYLSRHARSLKHLGYGAEAAQIYDDCLTHCANEHYRDTAMYLNNYLTLEIYRGNLAKASRMVAWNFATMQWLETNIGKANQLEHGGFSIGWLALLMGDFNTAQASFQLGATAWAGIEDEEIVFFDYYPAYFCEMYLIQDDNEARALAVLNRYLERAQTYGWKETEARCYIVSSMIQRHTAQQFAAKGAHLNAAYAFCSSAKTVLDTIFAPPVQIEYLHELLCLYFEDAFHLQLPHDLMDLMPRFTDLRQNLMWDLFLSDEVAFLGLAAFEKGDLQQAQKLFEKAEQTARAQNNNLALLSPYRPISMLRLRLNKTPAHDFDQFNGTASQFMDLSFVDIEPTTMVSALQDDFQTQPRRSMRR